jgi:hypothetical protein
MHPLDPDGNPGQPFGHHDLGDGCAHFHLPGGQRFALDLLEFFEWYEALPSGTDARAKLKAIQAHVKESHGVGLGLSQCDELVFSAHAQLEALAGKRRGRLDSLRGTAQQP